MAVIAPGGYPYPPRTPPRTPEELRKEKIFLKRILLIGAVGVVVTATTMATGVIYFTSRFEPPPKIEYFEDVTESGGRVKPVIRTNRGGEYFFRGKCFRDLYNGEIITCEYIQKSDLEKSVHE